MFFTALIWRWQWTVTPLDHRLQLLGLRDTLCLQLAYPGPELRLVPRHLIGDRVNATEDRHKSVLGERFIAPILLPNSAGRSLVSS